MYYHGQGVQANKKMAKHHVEIATVAGHVRARCNLGVIEWRGGNHHRAVKHFVISANAGDDDSMKAVQYGYKDGLVNKYVFEKTLRARKKSNDEQKSEWRDKAAAANYTIGLNV